MHARRLLDQALKVYGDRPGYEPERARTLYKKGQLLITLDKGDEAQAVLRSCFNSYRDAVPGNSRTLEELTTADFERPVIFWSK